MALDRFVVWQTKKPTREEIGRLLEDYVRGLATVEQIGELFVASLPGVVSRALRRAKAIGARNRKLLDATSEGGRWIEVFIGDDHIDVITRQADEVTNAIAEGFAALVARHYDARREGA